MYHDNSNPDQDINDEPDPGRWHYRVKVWLSEHQLLRTVYIRANNLIEVHDACAICFGKDAQVLSVKRLGEDIVASSVRFMREYPQYLS